MNVEALNLPCRVSLDELEYDRQQAEKVDSRTLFGKLAEIEADDRVAMLAETEWGELWRDTNCGISQDTSEELSKAVQHAFIMGDTCELGRIFERVMWDWLKEMSE